MKTAINNSTINRSKTNTKEEGKMKKLINILGIAMVTATLAVSSMAVAAETPVSKHNSAQAVSADSQFSALDGVQAEKMNDSEMNEVEGKYLLMPSTRYVNAYSTTTFVRPVCGACAIPINLP